MDSPPSNGGGGVLTPLVTWLLVSAGGSGGGSQPIQPTANRQRPQDVPCFKGAGLISGLGVPQFLDLNTGSGAKSC